MIDKKEMLRRFGMLWIAWIIVMGFTTCSRIQEAGVPTKSGRMTVDRLERADRYFKMHPAFQKAFVFLRQTQLSDWAPGRYELDGGRLFCTISKGPGKKRETARLEAHRKYIDIHYVMTGTETMGWKPTAACTVPDQSYDPDKDVEFFKDTPQRWINVPAGSFAIFFPQDAHAPMVGNGEIHKAIIKVAVE